MSGVGRCGVKRSQEGRNVSRRCGWNKRVTSLQSEQEQAAALSELERRQCSSRRKQDKIRDKCHFTKRVEMEITHYNSV